MPWGWIFVQIIEDERSTKVAKRIIVHWHLTFLRQGQGCFPIHLYEPHNICMGTLLRISDDDLWSLWAKFAQIFSLSEHEVLMVSCCGHSMSFVHHGSCGMRHAAWTIALKPTLPTPLGQLTRYLVGSIRVTCRSKIAKILPIGNPRWPPSWKSIFRFFSRNQLTPNLLGSIRATCRSNKVKIMSVGNPRWPPWQPSWKSIFRFYSLTQKPVDSKLVRKKRVREKSRECHNHKPQPFPDPKRKRKPTNPNKHKSNKRTKSTKISSLFPKRGNRKTKRT